MTPETMRAINLRYGIRFPTWNYTVSIDDVRRIAYFETPKVACTSIKKYMMDRYVGGEMVLPSKGAVHDRSLSPLRQLSTLEDEDAKAVLGAGYRRFTFCRNPYTRVLSAYLDKLVTNEWERKRHLPIFGFEPGARPTFLEFLERLSGIEDRMRDIHYMTQRRLTGGVGGLQMDYIGRFERFGEDFQTFKRRFYDDSSTEDYQSFGKHHASDAGSKIDSHYGPAEIALVQSIYAADFTQFGYGTRIEDALLA
ncbi:sulfotransferase family protein [Aliigemmobacter aestuarii]|nr:sulfotransferase family protein [Gemmobacter aestuarii]